MKARKSTVTKRGKHKWGVSLKADSRELLGSRRTDKQRMADSKKGA